LVEIDADLCALAEANARRNGFAERVTVIAADVDELQNRHLGAFGRVLMNPPFNDPRRHNVSPDPKRRRAHVAAPDLLARWVVSAAAALRAGGVLTLIWRADDLERVLERLQPSFGNAAVLPVHPRAGAAPIRVLVRAVKGAPWTLTDHPGLVLNDAAGKPTMEAEAILRQAQTLALAGLG
jgi:tRNA1(Val) A37 N6-methylase TrmN6